MQPSAFCMLFINFVSFEIVDSYILYLSEVEFYSLSNDNSCVYFFSFLFLQFLL